ISAGDVHVCAVIGSGRVNCWGANAHGNLGTGSTSDSPQPVLVRGLSGASSVSVRGWHSCALTPGGANCWGMNDNGELGGGAGHERHKPVSVAKMAGVTAVLAGLDHNLAVIG